MNVYGLPRAIPADVRREVRKNCGFGCVICGLGIVQYEHVDPEYHLAKEHDPTKIALLCPQCHAKITTKHWSKARVKLAMKNPVCKQVNYSKEVFDFCEGHPQLRFGGILLKNCPIPIEVAGYPLFSVKPPEQEGEPFRLSGTFTDSTGEISLIVKDNEWMAKSSSWDVEVTGGRIIIREGPRNIHLVLKAEPPHALVVEKLDMRLGGLHFLANGDFLKVEFPTGGVMEFTSCIADGCQVGMSF